MTFENSKYFNLLPSSKIEFSFGTFFFLDKIIVSEIYEGTHFGWDKIEQVISAAAEHYGDNFKVAFLSNRINSYSIEPQLWMKFYNEYHFIVASAIVAYNDFNFKNATLEKHFSKNSIKRCETLDEAMEWIFELKEFN